MALLSYFWRLTCKSFHGMLRVLEIGEALAATTVYFVGFFKHEWKERLEILFVVLVALIVLTFFCGLFIAAYASDRDAQKKLKEHESRLAPRVAITKVDTGSWENHFRITVTNVSDSTVLKCGVQLVWTSPPIDHLPIPLHCSHLTRPNSDLVDLNPKVSRVFDVLRYDRQQPGGRGQLDVAGAVIEPVIPLQRYRLRLMVHAQNCVPVERDLIFDKKDGGFEFSRAGPWE